MPEQDPVNNTYRYPSIRSFEMKEEKLFIGREKETQDLFNKVVADRLVLLFARSGIGKSSLLNAGLLPLLKKRGFFPIPVRLNMQEGAALDTPGKILKSKFNPYLDGTMIDDKKNIILPEGYDQAPRLWEYMKYCVFPLASTPVLVLDQFEQFFDFPQAVQDECISELNELVDDNVPIRVADWYSELPTIESKKNHSGWLEQFPVRIVIAIRSDRLYELNRLTGFIPAILRSRYELLPLDEQNARRAIETPALPKPMQFTSNDFKYAPELLDNIIKKLRGSNDVIETTQLQILCSEIEKKVIAPQEPGAVVKDPGYEVTQADIDNIGGFKSIIDKFYDNQVAQAGTIREVELAKRIIEDRLYDRESNSRRILFEEDALKILDREKKELHIMDLDNKKFLEHLLDLRLIREDLREKRKFYEISHDYLLTAIGASFDERERLRLEKYNIELEARNKELTDLKDRAEHSKADAIKAQVSAQEAEHAKTALYNQLEITAKNKAQLYEEMLQGRRRFRITVVIALLAGIAMLTWGLLQLRNNRIEHAKNELSYGDERYGLDEPEVAFERYLGAAEYNAVASERLDSLIFPVFAARSIITSPDSNYCLAMGKYSNGSLWNIKGGTPTKLFNLQQVEDALFSTNSNFLACVLRDSTLQIWNLSVKKTIPLKLETEKKQDIVKINPSLFQPYAAFSSSYCVIRDSGHFPNSKYYIISLSTGRVTKLANFLGQHKLPADISYISFSPDGRFLTVLTDSGNLSIYDLQDKSLNSHFENVKRYFFNPKEPELIVFLKNGKYVVNNCLLKKQSIYSSKWTMSEGADAAYSEDGKTMSWRGSYDPKAEYLFNFENNTLTKYPAGNITGPGNQVIAYETSDPSEIELRNRLNGQTLLIKLSEPSGYYTDQQSDRLFYVDSLSQLHLVNLSNMKELANPVPGVAIVSIVFSSSSRKMYFIEKDSDYLYELDLATNKKSLLTTKKTSLTRTSGKYLEIELLQYDKTSNPKMLLDPEVIKLSRKERLAYLDKFYRSVYSFQ